MQLIDKMAMWIDGIKLLEILKILIYGPAPEDS